MIMVGVKLFANLPFRGNCRLIKCVCQNQKGSFVGLKVCKPALQDKAILRMKNNILLKLMGAEPTAGFYERSFHTCAVMLSSAKNESEIPSVVKKEQETDRLVPPGTSQNMKITMEAFKVLQNGNKDKTNSDHSIGSVTEDKQTMANTVKQYIRMQRDFSKKYTENNTMTAVRAMQEYILKPSDLKDLRPIKVRSPYRDGDAHLIVYLERDVIAKAMEVHGSQENLDREIKRIKRLKDKQRHYLDWSGQITSENSMLRKNFFKSGPGRVVAVAAGANAVICAFKFTCWMWTGSASMFSEMIHSFVDMVNQLLLLYGVYQSTRTADAEHPYGFGNMRYIVSLISGVGIFCLGCGASMYHGITSIATCSGSMGNITSWSTFGVLVGSALIESASLIVALDETKHNAAKHGMSFWNFIRSGKDPCTNVVLMEDSCAVIGVGIAAVAITCTQLLNNPMYDYVGSLAIGGLLGVVALFLVRSNIDALIGQSMPQDHLMELREHLEDDAVIRGVYDIKATQLGYGEFKFKAEIDFDGREITRAFLEKKDLDTLLDECKGVSSQKQLEVFLLNHGEAIIDTLGSQVDRLEADLKAKNPSLRHIDLEVL